MNTADVAMIALTTLSVVVAGIAVWRAEVANSKTRAIDVRMLEIEEARETDRKASLTPATFTAKPSWNLSGLSRVEVHNIGEETAKDVRFFVNRQQLNGSIDEFLPGESVTLSGLPGNIPKPIYLHIKWVNPFGVEKSATEPLSRA